MCPYLLVRSALLPTINLLFLRLFLCCPGAEPQSKTLGHFFFVQFSVNNLNLASTKTGVSHLGTRSDMAASTDVEGQVVAVREHARDGSNGREGESEPHVELEL